jgi:hypothetical protein
MKKSRQCAEITFILTTGKTAFLLEIPGKLSHGVGQKGLGLSFEEVEGMG